MSRGRSPERSVVDAGGVSHSLLRRRASRIARLLEDEYGTPDLGNKQDPLDELVFIILAQMTTSPSYSRVFDRLKASVRTWDRLAEIPLRRLRATIEDAGLSGQKGPRLKAIVKRILTDFGELSLDSLRAWDDAQVETYLTSLPGVGLKTAKCVMMYSLGRHVLPVDTHVKRLLVRVGLLPPEPLNSRLHEASERVVRPADRYSIHVNGVVHGRRTCLAARPRCASCCLKRCCEYVRARPYQSVVNHVK